MTHSFKFSAGISAGGLMAKKLAFERYYQFLGQINAGRYPIGANVEGISPEEPGEKTAKEMDDGRI
jgi:hypothetical protein